MAVRALLFASFSLATVAAQDPVQRLSNALKSATYWKTIGQTQKDELQQVQRAEKVMYTNMAVHSNSDATAGARLAACLRTRGAAQVQLEQLQRENANVVAEVEGEQRERTVANETALRKIAECEVRVNKTLSSTTEHWESLQQHYETMQAEHKKMQEEVQQLAKFKETWSAKIEAQKKDQAAKLAALKKKQDAKLEEMKSQAAKVLEAHRVLKTAHDVLEKRHAELEQKTLKSRPNHTEIMKGRQDASQCHKELASSKQAEAKMHEQQEQMRAAASKQGSQETDMKWSQELKNLTATKKDLEVKLHSAMAEDVQQVKQASVATKDVPDMELKLRRCLESREKTELDFQRVLKRCPQKAAFVQEYVQEWP